MNMLEGLMSSCEKEIDGLLGSIDKRDKEIEELKKKLKEKNNERHIIPKITWVACYEGFDNAVDMFIEIREDYDLNIPCGVECITIEVLNDCFEQENKPYFLIWFKRNMLVIKINSKD